MSCVCFQVVLDFAQALRIVLRPGSEQLLDALLATRVRPFAAQIVRIVVAVNALIGGGEEAINCLLRQLLVRQIARPVVLRIPAQALAQGR